MSTTTPKPPISSGWRGNINGHIEGTDACRIQATEVTLKLDRDTAWALCNLLGDDAILRSCSVEKSQAAALSTVGAALARFIDHPAANNGGRQIIK